MLLLFNETKRKAKQNKATKPRKVKQAKTKKKKTPTSSIEILSFQNIIACDKNQYTIYQYHKPQNAKRAKTENEKLSKNITTTINTANNVSAVYIQS